jgi:exonuclease SbcC
MRPVRLEVEGFTCFRERQVVDFEGLELFTISGPTGAGKSSLLDAVMFALYGDVPRIGSQGLRALIAHGATELKVVFDFDLGKERFRIMRKLREGRGSTTVQLDRANGSDFDLVADRVGEVDRGIEALLGLDVEAFKQAVMLPQGQIAQFLNSAPAERQKILEQLLRSEVYARMARLAGEAEKEAATKRSSAERALREDFDGVTPEALATARSELERLDVATAERAAVESGRRVEEVRIGHERTEHLEAKRRVREALREQEATIGADRTTLDRARRAAGVWPVVARAAEVRAEASARRKGAASEADRARSREADLVDRLRGHERAMEAAADLPARRERLRDLDRIGGRAPELARVKERLRSIGSKAMEIGRRAVEASSAREGAERDLEVATVAQRQAEEELASVAFDRGRHERLEQIGPAVALIERDVEERARLESKRSELDGACAAAAGAVAAADQALEASMAEVETTRRDLREAVATARGLERRHAAVDLARHVKPGDPCPVCARAIVGPIGIEEPPDLGRAREAVEHLEAKARRLDAEHVANERAAARSHEQRRSVAEELASVAQAIERLDDRVEQAITELRSELDVPRQDVGAWHGAEITRSRHLEVAHRRSLEAIARSSDHMRSLDSKRVEAARELQRLEEERAALDRDRSDLDRVRSEIEAEVRRIAGDADPIVLRETLAKEIARIEDDLAGAAGAVTDARSAHEAAKVALAAAEAVANETDVNAAAAEAQAREVVNRNGFASADEVEAAHRTSAEIEALEARIRKHDQAVAGVEAGIADLEAALGSIRVTAEELHAEERAHGTRMLELDAMKERRTVLTRSAADLEQRLARAERYRDELAAESRRHTLYGTLAGHLRRDELPRFVLTETFEELAAGASLRLRELTRGRYTLRFEAEDLQVVDHDNARQTRSSKTLSGGETFLASLALALELSEQVYKTTGAVRLDSLFIDEGFGTLDAESLAVACECIQTLGSAGRMVGIITHIADLREELDQQIRVCKSAKGSTISVVAQRS